MSSTTQLGAFNAPVMRWIAAAYDELQTQRVSLSKLAQTRYESLGQDPHSSKRNRRFRSGVPSLCRVLAYLAAALSVGLLFVIYTRGTGIGSSSPAAEDEAQVVGLNSNSSFDTPALSNDSDRATISRDGFIAAVVRDPVEGLVDLAPIQQKCNETKFQDGLIWHCAPVNGGIGNVANMVLNCVRYALEAGATTLILPRIQIRSDNLINLGNKDQSAEMSYLLDADYFLESWKLACPQMRALVSESDLDPNYNISSIPKAVLSPDRVKSFERRKYLIVDPAGWREAFDAWMLKNPSTFQNMSTSNPARVWQNLAFAQWNRLVHPGSFANSFPRLLRHLPLARRLAASALYTLDLKMGATHSSVSDTILFPSNQSQSTVNSLSPNRLARDSFLGAHLRVAADAAAAGWPGYEAQAPIYISQAVDLNLSTIYLATGSPQNRDQFRTDAALQNLTTYTKEDLLSESELAELAALTWDQQALVDFEVLMHSAMFCGFVRSSYSWALALRRGTLPEAGVPLWSTDEHEYRDGLSAIVARYGSINPEGLWP